jgi:NitT/TauT family transport system substrate-binding protein
MITRRQLILAGATSVLATPAWPSDALEPVRIATLKTGTVAWEVDSIIHNGFDQKHGIALSLVPVAGKQSADVLLAGGAADIIVSDWIWVSRQRQSGADYTFVPYSKQVGSILVSEGSTIRGLADLKGKKIGVAGGPTDKSWVIFRALALKDLNLDLAKECEPVFAAPPLLSEQLLAGSLDALITFWQFAAILKTKGAREIATVKDAAISLGLDANTPLLGFVYSAQWSKAHHDAAAKLAAASADAKALLASNDAEWDRLRPLMNVNSDAEFTALKSGFRMGIPNGGTIDRSAAAKLFSVLASVAGAELTGGKAEIAEGTFAAN